MKLNHPGLLVMPATQYHAEKAIGHSGIVKMLKSPAHLREYLDHPHQPTPAMAFGTAVHTYVLEQDRFAEEFVVAEKFDRRTKEGKEAAARFEEANQGKIVITSEEMSTLTLVQRAVFAHQGAAQLLSVGDAELSAFWTDADTGLNCKCRPDWFNGDAIVDLKTCVDASSSGFSKSIANFGYDIQTAYYVGRDWNGTSVPVCRCGEGRAARGSCLSRRSRCDRDRAQEIPGGTSALEVVPGIGQLAGVPTGWRD
ncbi:protein of unknown function [Denitratisoma oestradiolicum]|uniref:Putative exodeoxyribonuclease 8 PDDEXK-like domain-containing protein n=1 Tax=Denitratisoma oestradiolicum TaxID=311182 RepID=A0A6S6XXG5_9PROT|nr:PD-(D/E)XK nuclease-like domain-containing protein [Denitratisoma oestradiolicum]TWO82086.1 hypothetical protein CBW56_01205 [Denitratisoma oestradiolicum]CAB1369015.1 protein of unknown function [Denitratisoma oestradiolicum]